ncbi:hypothetical protein SUGI_1061490 [Cryptomeria japonica]|nr:hypothetical protein SUGI_1061490 [Cryptomeria japonica]
MRVSAGSVSGTFQDQTYVGAPKQDDNAKKKGEANSEDGGDPNMGFQVDPNDGTPKAGFENCPYENEESRGPRSNHKITGVMERSFLSRVTNVLAILCGGAWVVGRSSLTLRKWVPNMDMSDTFFEMIHVWVRLKGIPLEYSHEDIFKGIVGI